MGKEYSIVIFGPAFFNDNSNYCKHYPIRFLMRDMAIIIIVVKKCLIEGIINEALFGMF